MVLSTVVWRSFARSANCSFLMSGVLCSDVRGVGRGARLWGRSLVSVFRLLVVFCFFAVGSEESILRLRLRFVSRGVSVPFGFGTSGSN